MMSPPIHSQLTRGWRVARMTMPGSRPRGRRERHLDVGGQGRLGVGRCDHLSARDEALERRGQDLAVDDDGGLVLDAIGMFDDLRRLVDDLGVAEADRVAGLHLELALTQVRGARDEAQRHGDDAEVHDHAAVGASDEAAPTLATGRQHQLAQARPRRETGQSEREQRGQTPSPHEHREHQRARRSRTTPATRDGWRSSSPLALRHGSTGATAMRNSR